MDNKDIVALQKDVNALVAAGKLALYFAIVYRYTVSHPGVEWYEYVGLFVVSGFVIEIAWGLFRWSSGRHIQESLVSDVVHLAPRTIDNSRGLLDGLGQFLGGNRRSK